MEDFVKLYTIAVVICICVQCVRLISLIRVKMFWNTKDEREECENERHILEFMFEVIFPILYCLSLLYVYM